jgi:hypothetical protein
MKLVWPVVWRLQGRVSGWVPSPGWSSAYGWPLEEGLGFVRFAGNFISLETGISFRAGNENPD